MQDTALQSSVSALHRVRELTLAGMSAGTATSPQAREAHAAEVDALREQLLGYANTTYIGRPVFGGTTGGTRAYGPDASYVGGAGQVVARLGDNATVRADTDGEATFGNGPQSLFAVLGQLSTDLRAGSPALATNLDQLDAASAKVLNALTDVGGRYSRTVQTRQDTQDKILSLQSSLSGVEDIDLPKTITELKMQETAYQAALGATARVLQPSLLDFLR